MNILFDLDGTLTDPYRGIRNCIAHALDAMGAPVPERLEWCVGPPLRESFRKLLEGHPGGDVEQAMALYRERFSERGLYENVLYPGVPEMLAILTAAGHALFVATSKPWVYAGKIVEHFGLSRYFRRVHGAELDGTRTAKGELIRHILAREGIEARQTVMVGDREHDLIGAAANGLRALAAAWGYGSREELISRHPEAILATPKEAGAYLLAMSVESRMPSRPGQRPPNAPKNDAPAAETHPPMSSRPGK